MSRRWWIVASMAALGAAVTCASLVGTAHAKPWAKWAPAPLASDSSYAALSAQSSDSLTASELLWLWAQRDWREQRDEEARHVRRTGWSGRPHRARRTDARFAALASQPYVALADSDRAWLIAENAAQRAVREETGSSNAPGVVVLGAILGALLAVWIIYGEVLHSP